jgi:hypothetical protein
MTQKPRPIPLRPQFTEPHIHFERAAFAAVMAVARDLSESEGSQFFPDDGAVPILLRSEAAIGSTSGWASDLAQQAMGSFLQSLAPQSAAAALMVRGISVDLARFSAVSVPGRATVPGRLPWVGEGQPIPVSSQILAATSIEPKKMGWLTVFSGELSRRSDAQGAFTALLRESASLSLDAGYFSDDAGDDVTHQGLLYGVSPTVPAVTSGTMEDDLAALAVAVGTGGSGQVIFITGPGRAAAMAIRSPNLKVPVLSSLAVPEDRVIAIDPLSLVHGIGSAPEITAARSALLNMSDEPGPIVDGTASAPVRSLYQTDAIALRCLIDAAFGARRAGAVAYMDDVSW